MFQKKLTTAKKEDDFKLRVLKNSVFFDDKWYSLRYPGVRQENAFEHYYRTGWKLGYNPSIYFNSKNYLNLLLDSGIDGECPLIHYELIGKKKYINRLFYNLINNEPLLYERAKSCDILILNKLKLNDGVYYYRMAGLKDELLNFNIKVNLETIFSPTRNLAWHLISAKAVIISRPDFDENFIDLYLFCKKFNKKLIVDLDDLLLPTFKKLDLGGIKSRTVKIDSYEDFIKRIRGDVSFSIPQLTADYLLCSTVRLCDIYQNLFNIRTLLRKNLLPLSLVKDIKPKQKIEREKFKIHSTFLDGRKMQNS